MYQIAYSFPWRDKTWILVFKSEVSPEEDKARCVAEHFAKTMNDLEVQPDEMPEEMQLNVLSIRSLDH